jgi:hypothetical protein
MNDQYLYSFSNITIEEIQFIKEITASLDDES